MTDTAPDEQVTAPGAESIAPPRESQPLEELVSELLPAVVFIADWPQ